MAIGGIGSYGSYYNYYQTLSQVRLEKALAKNPKYQKAVQPVESVDSVGSSFKSNAMDFLKSYSSTMSNVMQSANELRSSNAKSVQNDLTAVSSNTDVADVSLRYKYNTGKDVTLDVQSIATAQMNSSEGVKASGAAVSDMAFEVTGGKGAVSVSVSAVKDNGTAKTNREMLQEAAKQINAGGTGVQAAVSEKDGMAVIELKSSSTGTHSVFTVSGTTGAAQGIENVGNEAQNAEYTVTNQYGTQSYSSQNNKVILDAGRIEAELKGTGSTEITKQPDNDKIVKAMSNLVDSYNQAVKFLSSNVSHGKGVANQLNGFERVLGDSRIMDRLGISKEKNGTLELDKDKLKQSLEKEPELTRELITGSSGMAQSMFNKASSAMRANSASLVNYDLENYDQEMLYDPIQFMGMYSRRGAQQMNNFAAIGLLMNYLA